MLKTLLRPSTFGLWLCLAFSAASGQDRPLNAPSAPTASQLEAKRKCPSGPYERCGEIVGAFSETVFVRNSDKARILAKDMPPHERTIGGRRFKIPVSFARVLDPTGSSNQMIAYWVPIAHMANGDEVAGTKFARDSIKHGLMWPFGMRIHITTNRLPGKRPSSYSDCKSEFIDQDHAPSKTAFGMTLYVDRKLEATNPAAKSDGCFVSDDPRYQFSPGVPVTYRVRFHNTRSGSTAAPLEERAVGSFTIHDDSIYIEYMFQTAMFPYWREIHAAVLALVQSWQD